MSFKENDLEEIIYNSSRELLEERGLYIKGKLLRQVRIGNYGIADLISIERYHEDFNRYEKNYTDPRLKITVYELKKDKIGISAFLQALGYLKGIKRYFDKRFVKYDISLSICLLGSEVDSKSTFCFLPSVINDEVNDIEFITLCEYKYKIDGIYFEYNNDFALTNEGF